MRKKWFVSSLLLLALMLLPQTSPASLGISIATERMRNLTYEPIHLTLSLHNDTGNTLNFGNQEQRNGHLFFRIEDGSGNLAPKLQDINTLIDNLVIPAGASRNVTFALNSFYSMAKQSDFSVYAQIGHQRLNTDYRSNRIRVEVRHGFPVWQRTFGLPSQDENAKIVNRTASILRFNEHERELYCLQIADHDFVYAVHRIAYHITGAQPYGEVDAMGHIHIFLRIRSRIFLYQVYDFHGNLKQEKNYTFAEGSPSLFRDSRTGTIRVVGGREAIRGLDYVLPQDAGGTLREDGTPVLEPL